MLAAAVDESRPERVLVTQLFPRRCHRLSEPAGLEEGLKVWEGIRLGALRRLVGPHYLFARMAVARFSGFLRLVVDRRVVLAVALCPLAAEDSCRNNDCDWWVHSEGLEEVGLAIVPLCVYVIRWYVVVVDRYR